MLIDGKFKISVGFLIIMMKLAQNISENCKLTAKDVHFRKC
jgi:hypothetical protein